MRVAGTGFLLSHLEETELYIVGDGPGSAYSIGLITRLVKQVMGEKGKCFL